jgi:hypothetical protein
MGRIQQKYKSLRKREASQRKNDLCIFVSLIYCNNIVNKVNYIIILVTCPKYIEDLAIAAQLTLINQNPNKLNLINM